MNPSDTPVPPTHSAKRLTPALLVLGVLAILAGGALGLYGIVHDSGKLIAHTGACAQSLDLAQAVDPLARGELAALTLATRPNQLGPISFDDANGRKTTVAAFAGKTILLNLWATWCVPCRQEMPALDNLQGALGDTRFSVIPVNIDQLRLDKPRAFFKDIGVKNLPFYVDSSADILQALRGKGLPTTVLIGKDGCEIGTMAGPAQWDSREAQTLIQRLEVVAPAKSAEL